MAKICELPVQSLTARAGFIAQAQPLTAPAQTLYKLADVIGAVQKIAKMPHVPAACPIGNRNGNRRLVDIHSHEDVILIRSVPHV